MKRVFVSGASGFIGRHVLPLLVSMGYSVVANARHPGDALEGVEWRCADILQPGTLERAIDEVRPTHLLHLAWVTESGRFWNDPANADWVDASARLYSSFVRNKGRRAVFAGTCAEYDWAHSRLSPTETPLAPRTLYGASKNILRQTVEQRAARDGISVAWGRIFMLYGPYEDSRRFVPYVINALLDGREALCGHGLQRRDLMHVADVAAAFALLVDSPQSGVFNIASGEATRLKDVAEKLADIIGRPHLLRLGARPVSPDEPDALLADVSHLRALGFQPSFLLSDGLSQTVRWWKARRRELS